MKRETLFLSAVLTLAGCASSGPTATDERLALYKAHSTPVESFRITKLQGRLSRWSVVGDQAVVVWDEKNQPVLLELPEKCDGLFNSKSIGLTNTTGTVTPGSDSVRLLSASRAGADLSCKIGTASHIDMAAVDKARKQAHASAS
jgi:Family of unknown function (DUF6491)